MEWEYLTELGFSRDEARSAFERCGNVDAAAEFLLTLSDADRAALVAPPMRVETAPECKMVLCVRTDLEISLGKTCAQCAHAAVDLVLAAQRSRNPALNFWKQGGSAKIVLGISGVSEMHSLAQKAKSQGLQTTIVADAGRTQVEPGTETVLGIGPGPIPLIDSVTGHLRLL